jgi:hypothetical protein
MARRLCEVAKAQTIGTLASTDRPRTSRQVDREVADDAGRKLGATLPKEDTPPRGAHVATSALNEISPTIPTVDVHGPVDKTHYGG